MPHALKPAADPDEPPRYLRLTHQFAGAFFGMWVTDEAGARYARRPVAFTQGDLADLEKEGGVWGRLALPDDLLPQLAEGEPDPTDGAWRIVAPLVESFKSEKNLGRTMFTHLVHLRASETGANPRTVLRLVNRYYYFGQVRPALGRLQPGPAPGRRTVAARSVAADASQSDPEATSGTDETVPRHPKRRGRKSSLEATLGPNTFVVSDVDITDMVKRLASMARKGRTFVSDAYEEYLKIDFKARHPTVFEDYAQKRHPAPVSLKQYRQYTNEYLQFERDIARNLRTRRSGLNYNGSLDASGPGDVYEIDATAGRIVLTTAGPNRRLVAKPTIYIIIDRWSRYIVSIYVSLKAPSWDEARYALLIAFTSRTKRFRALGIDTDDQRWPVGRMCTVLRRDRGSELTSESMDRVVAGDLKADPSSLPPITPNGKAIVERFIRTMKAWMAKEVKGTYADRPIDLHSKRQAKKERELSVHSLAELYRELVRFVEAYNDKPHSWLKKMSILRQAGVPPTPKEAYLWGSKNITGVRVSSYTDEQLQRIMLGVDKASISDGQILYKSRRYNPVNEAAQQYAATSPKKRKEIQVRVDKTFPYELYVESRTEWPRFEMVAADRRAMGVSTLDEYEERKPLANADDRALEHDQTRSRVTGAPSGRNPKPDVDRNPQSQRQLADDRQEQSTALKAALVGKSAPTKKQHIPHQQGQGPHVPEWKRRLEAQRQASIDAIEQSKKDEE